MNITIDFSHHDVQINLIKYIVDGSIITQSRSLAFFTEMEISLISLNGGNGKTGSTSPHCLSIESRNKC